MRMLLVLVLAAASGCGPRTTPADGEADAGLDGDRDAELDVDVDGAPDVGVDAGADGDADAAPDADSEPDGDAEASDYTTPPICATGEVSYACSCGEILVAGGYCCREVPLDSPCSMSGVDYYLSPTGDDSTGDGSRAHPWFTLARAWEAIEAGDTVYLHGGTYAWDSKQSLTGRNGTAENVIRIWAYPGETPNLTDTDVFSSSGWPTVLIWFTGDHFHWKGIEISYVEQHSSTDSRGSMYIWNANDNVFELFDVHHNGNGFNIYEESTGNLVLNGDFHHNQDPYSSPTPYENADGLAPNFTSSGTVNTIRGCRMWWNCDDGIDMYSNDSRVIVEDSWAFYNGYVNDTFEPAGNGNGFKLGDTDDDHGSEILVTVRNCVAYRNRTSGFHQNGADARMELYHNTSYANGAQGYWFDSFGQPHVLKNNIAYGNDETALISTESSLEANTFLYSEDDNPAYAVSDEDFVSLDPSGLTAPRQADGSLPALTFLHLAPGSDLIDSGVDVGLPFHGAAPDLGAFEN